MVLEGPDENPQHFPSLKPGFHLIHQNDRLRNRWRVMCPVSLNQSGVGELLQQCIGPWRSILQVVPNCLFREALTFTSETTVESGVRDVSPCARYSGPS
jgi:hypothetical protein